MNKNEMWNAVKDCDAAYDGAFYYGVKTTGIYCRPSCESKLPKQENVTYFRTREEAEAAGFRPCKRCRPDLLGAYDPAAELSAKAKDLIDRSYSDRAELSKSMRNMGVTRKHLTEVFKKEYDITPSEYLLQTRIASARSMLQDGVSVLDTSVAVGYASPSAFYDHFRRITGMTPARYRQIFARDISRSALDTPIGSLRIIAGPEAILCVEQAGRELGDAGMYADKIPADHVVQDSASGELLEACKAELGEYFAGKRRAFDLPLLPEGTDFQKSVWGELRRIPYGETRTYGELAAMTGNAKASRAVGMANHCNPILILIPCHRVIGANGSLTGYAAGIEAKRYLLQLEKGTAA